MLFRSEGLARDVDKLDGVDHVRGRGLMLGVVLDRPVAKEAVQIGLQHGVILNAPTESVLRLTPPLVITGDELRAATDAIATTLEEALSRFASSNGGHQ